MRILVADDQEKRLESAKHIFEGHDLTIANSFEQAMEIMKIVIDEEKVKRHLIVAGFTSEPDKSEKERYAYYQEKLVKAKSYSAIPLQFDAVFTAMVPEVTETSYPKSFKTIPHGFLIAIRAALLEVKFVATVADISHYKNAMNTSISQLDSGCIRFEEGLRIDLINVMLLHAPFLEKVLGKKRCVTCEGSGICRTCKGTGTRKVIFDEKKRRYVYDVDACYNCSSLKGKRSGSCKWCHGTGKVDYSIRDWQVLDSSPNAPASII